MHLNLRSVTNVHNCVTWSSHSSGYEVLYNLWLTQSSQDCQPTFRRNISPPFSWTNTKLINIGATSLTRGGSVVFSCWLSLANGVFIGCESRGNHDHIWFSQYWDSPNLESQVPVFISPIEQCSLVIHQALGLSNLFTYYPLRWPPDTLCQQKLALTSPTSGGGSAGIVRSRRSFLQDISKVQNTHYIYVYV
jgi:hypothetical protein